MNLIQQKCVPCEVGGDPLPKNEVDFYAKDVQEWKVASDYKMISRVFSFKDFKGSLAFVNKVGDLAESEGHHPDIKIHWNEVTLELWTHEVKGLSVNDFILAAKVDQIK